MKRIKIYEAKPMKVIWVNEKHDTDRDKVPNYMDCNPWNPYQQGWLHDKLTSLKEKSEEKKDIAAKRERQEKEFGELKTKSIIKKATEEGINKQLKNVGKPKYVYTKIRGRWNFAGGYDAKVVDTVVSQLASQRDVENVQTSDRDDMESYFNRRDFKESAKAYVEKQGWNENVKKGLMTREKQSMYKRLEDYQKIIALERQITGVSPVIMHSGQETMNAIRGTPRAQRTRVAREYSWPPRAPRQTFIPFYVNRRSQDFDESNEQYE